MSIFQANKKKNGIFPIKWRDAVLGCGGNLLQRSIQYLLVIPGLWCTEGLAGKVGEVGGGEAGEDQLPGAEGLIFQLELPVGGVVAVLAVADLSGKTFRAPKPWYNQQVLDGTLK